MGERVRETRYRGVRWLSQSKRWAAQIAQAGKRYHLGVFVSEDAAARTYDRAALALFGARAVINFPGDRTIVPTHPADLAAERRTLMKSTTGSRYRGVARVANGRWQVHAAHAGVLATVHGFEDETEAAIAHDRLLLGLGGPSERLNFPKRALSPATAKEVRQEVAKRARREQHASRARTSRYCGVYRANNGLWRATIEHEGRVHLLGSYKREKDAAEVRDRVALYLLGANAKLNFPNAKSLVPESPETLLERRRRERKDRASSTYLGVTWSAIGKWVAYVKRDGRARYLGAFDDEEEAARAHDRGALALFGASPGVALNFPRAQVVPATPAELRREGRAAFKATTTSQYRGVSWSKTAERWEVAIKADGIRHRLGFFEDEHEAALVYDRAARKLHGDRATPNFSEEPSRKRRS